MTEPRKVTTLCLYNIAPQVAGRFFWKRGGDRYRGRRIIMLCILLFHYHYYIVMGGIFGRTVVHLTRVSVVGNQTDDII